MGVDANLKDVIKTAWTNASKAAKFQFFAIIAVMLIVPVTISAALSKQYYKPRAASVANVVTPPRVTPSPTATSTPKLCAVCPNSAGNVDTCKLSKCTKRGATVNCNNTKYCCGSDGYWGSSYDSCNSSTLLPKPRQTPISYPEKPIPLY